MRVGLVGCGGMGNAHLNLLKRLPEHTLVGVCDHRPDRALRMGTSHEIPFWTDFERFLDEAKPQALHICSPTGFHADHGLAAARRGIHLLCEKPLDTDLNKADRLIAECDLQNVRLGCIFQKRASKGAQEVQKAVGSGKMGTVLSCSVSVKWWRSQAYYDKDDWRGTRAFDGGAFSNQGIHSLDLMTWFAGPVAEVEYASLSTLSHSIESEDFGIAVVRFESGARGTIEISTCCLPDLSTRLEIFGTNGSALLDDARVTRFGIAGQDRLASLPDPGTITGGGTRPFDIDLTGHEVQMRDFYAAIRENRRPLLDGHAARVSLDLLTKIYRKAYEKSSR